MQSPQNLGALARASDATAYRQPRRYRHRINSLTYLKLDTIHGGILRNLNEDGVAIQVVGPLRVGQQLALRFELLHPRLRVEACGCVVWANPHGQAGVEFLDVPAAQRRQLKEWIFNQLLATAERVGAESIFMGQQISPEAQELTFSENARSPILLESEPAVVVQHELSNHQPMELASRGASKDRGSAPPWWVVDGLILLSAVLLFSVIALGMTSTVPAWPVALVLMLAVTGSVAGLYWFLFQFWMGATPGEHLARLTSEAAMDFGLDGSEEDRPRFR